jgi:hypothetical protein
VIAENARSDSNGRFRIATFSKRQLEEPHIAADVKKFLAFKSRSV